MPVRRHPIPSRQMRSPETQTQRRQHLVPTRMILDLARASGCTAYDCEYVALAMQLDVPLVTSDKEVRRAFPAITQPL